MKRLLPIAAIVVALLAMPASHLLGGKAHVPVHKAQVCHKGTVIVVSENAVQGHLRGHGDCHLPACDFANIFGAGASCTVDDRGDGKCVLPLPRDEAVNDACPAGKF